MRQTNLRHCAELKFWRIISTGSYLLFDVFRLVTKSSDDRKIELTKYFKKTRVQFYRLLFLMRWSNQIDTIETAKVCNVLRRLWSRHR
jgi:hypothetical protein